MWKRPQNLDLNKTWRRSSRVTYHSRFIKRTTSLIYAINQPRITMRWIGGWTDWMAGFSWQGKEWNWSQVMWCLSFPSPKHQVVQFITCTFYCIAFCLFWFLCSLLSSPPFILIFCPRKGNISLIDSIRFQFELYFDMWINHLTFIRIYTFRAVGYYVHFTTYYSCATIYHPKRLFLFFIVN